MKNLTLATVLAAAVLSTGCASFTKGVDTARGTVLGAIDTVRTAVDKGFSVVGKGAETAQKIVDTSVAGTKETVTPVTAPQ